ncbi:MAG: thioredoxin family protein [Candidatus Pacebacteria bacterium]|nr:thioredoxin family protein [Candidatus Paceibacterota bacterium]
MNNLIDKIKQNKTAIFFTASGIIIIGLIIYITQSCSLSGEQLLGALSTDEASQKVIDFINENLNGMATASLVSIEEKSGLYMMKIKLSDNQGNMQEEEAYLSLDGKLLFPSVIKLAEIIVGDFSVSEEEVCLENGKPIAYFFGSNSCPHCAWEHPIFQKVMEKFKDQISFHDNMEGQGDQDILYKFNPQGGIPTMVLGCKYYKIGSGEKDGEETETKNLTAVVCKLTGNKPEAVCSEVKDLVNQIP